MNLQLFAEKLSANANYENRMTEADARLYYNDEGKEALYQAYTAEKYFDTIYHPKNAGTKGRLTFYDKMVTNAGSVLNAVLPKEDTPFGKYFIDYSLDFLGGYIRTTKELDLLSPDKNESARLHRSQLYAAGEVLQDKAAYALASTTNVYIAGATVKTSLKAAQETATGFDLEDFMSKIKPALIRSKVKGPYTVLLAPEVVASALTTKKDSGYYTLLEIAQNLKKPKVLTEGQIADFNQFTFVEDTEGLVKPIYTKTNGDIVWGNLIMGTYRGEKGASVVKLEGQSELQSIIIEPKPAIGNDLGQVGSLGWHVDGIGYFVKYPQAVMLYECVAGAPASEINGKSSANYNGGYNASGTAVAKTTQDVVVNGNMTVGGVVVVKSVLGGKVVGQQEVIVAVDGVAKYEELGALTAWREDSKNTTAFASTGGVVDLYTTASAGTKITETTIPTGVTTVYAKLK